jgi:hypothetical protein
MTSAIALFTKFDSTFISLASSFKLRTTFQRSHPIQLQHFPLTQGSAHQYRITGGMGQPRTSEKARNISTSTEDIFWS